MPYTEIEGFRFGTLNKHYAQTALSRLKETKPYKDGKNQSHVQVNGEKITWRKI